MLKGKSAAPPAKAENLPAVEDDNMEILAAQDGERLEEISRVIDEASRELLKLEQARSALEALSEPLRAEFKARIKDNAQLASISSKLGLTQSRLNERESELKQALARLGEVEAQLNATTEANALLTAAKQAGERDIIELRAAIQSLRTECEELKVEKQISLNAQSAMTLENASLSTRVAQYVAYEREWSAHREKLEDENARALSEVETLRRRCEQVRAEAMESERRANETEYALKNLSEERSVLEAQFATFRAEAGRNSSDYQAAEALKLTEIQKLKDALEDALARCTRLEAAREARAAELQSVTEDRASLVRTLSAKDLELNQLRSRAENLDATVSELRARLSDVESARATAITRAETLAKENSVLESRADRAEMGLISRMAAFKNLTDSFEDQKTRFNQEIQELSGHVARQKTEIGMLRGALESSKRSKLLSTDWDQ
ncbi:MAG: hypothetical protein CGW95_12640 [Phenylobacterium zucineum]|nr:MAG: hypothetical protein CGW95_12640 [Phenylobacterium zucineum]